MRLILTTLFILLSTNVQAITNERLQNIKDYPKVDVVMPYNDSDNYLITIHFCEVWEIVDCDLTKRFNN